VKDPRHFESLIDAAGRIWHVHGRRQCRGPKKTGAEPLCAPRRLIRREFRPYRRDPATNVEG
jgi:hypothetical protein